MVKIIDRRNQAMGGQSNNRKLSAIKNIAWHYTAVARRQRATIQSHERYWRNTRGWNRGGYHFYIDADGKVYQNYNLTTISNGVGGNNSYTVHISVEANSASDYSEAQINARHELTLYLMGKLGLKASAVKQHKEFPGQSTTCAGYTKAQMNEFRRLLAGGKASKPSSKPSKPKPAKQKWSKVSGNWTGQTLKRGQYGKPVRQLQEMLASKHYYPNKGAKNNGVDGYFGADTLDAVKRYQSMFGLTVDGLPGKSTYASLKGAKAKSKSTGSWTGQTLRRGHRGKAVRQLQEMLAAKYYYPDKGARNNGIDSIFGRKTEDAVRRYQSMHGLAVDGLAGRATYNSLRK